MNPRARHLLTGTTLAATLLVGVPALAQAAPTPSTTQPSGAAAQARTDRLDELKARCDAAITRRTTTLDQLGSRVRADTSLPPEVAGPLQSLLTNDTTGLNALRGQIDAATDAATARTGCQKIVTDYRVYVLVVPQVHLSTASQRELVVAGRLADAHTKLSDLVAEAAAAGKDVGDADVLLADLSAKVGDARTKATPVASTVLALTPTQYDAGTARPVLQAQHDAVTAARDDLGAAGQDAKQVVQLLRGLR
ncbi:MAG: hypothetical protein R2726_22175 [Acidimicrobiales bacterium]